MKAWTGIGRVAAASSLIWLATAWAGAADRPLDPQLAKIRAVGPMGVGHRDAIPAWQTVSRVPASRLPEVLAGMDGANPLAANWIRSACETIAQRTLDQGDKLPVAELEAYLADVKHAALSRRLAYELIAKVDANAEMRLIPGLVNDPSLELRRDAVALAIAAAQKINATENREAAIKAYGDIFRSARDKDQIKLATDKLRGLEQKVDVSTHYGFLPSWHVVAPFDNVGTKGFNVAYPPEDDVDLEASYDGKSEKVRWQPVVTQDDLGYVNLNTSLSKYKGAIAYAYATFTSSREQDVDLRLGTPNANKLWLNGQLIATNNIYHANTALDQYITKARLKAGRNTILLKIAQNEQTEEWAQDWTFQLRICDSIGTAILSLDRPNSQTAAIRP